MKLQDHKIRALTMNFMRKFRKYNIKHYGLFQIFILLLLKIIFNKNIAFIFILSEKISDLILQTVEARGNHIFPTHTAIIHTIMHVDVHGNLTPFTKMKQKLPFLF